MMSDTLPADDRERLAAVMARNRVDTCCDRSGGCECDYECERFDRSLAFHMEQVESDIAAAERAGFRWGAPKDG